MSRGLKQTFKYGTEEISITDLLKKLEVINYLEKGKKLTYPSLREKLRKELRKHRENLRRLVTDYNLENPRREEERRQQDVLYGAQRRRKNLPKKDTKGRVFFGPKKPPQPPRRRRI